MDTHAHCSVLANGVTRSECATANYRPYLINTKAEERMNAYFRSLSFDSVITALVGDDAIAIAKNDDSVLLPLEVAVEVAAETLRLLLDDERLRNHRRQALAGYLGETEDMELRRILDRISGPDRPTFTSC